MHMLLFLPFLLSGEIAQYGEVNYVLVAKYRLIIMQFGCNWGFVYQILKTRSKDLFTRNKNFFKITTWSLVTEHKLEISCCNF